MEIMTGAGHGGGVIRNAVELQIFCFGGGNHLVHGVISVTAGDGVSVNVEHINQNISSFNRFDGNYITRKLFDQIICDRISPMKMCK